MVRWEAEHNGTSRTGAAIPAAGIDRPRPAAPSGMTARFIDLLNLPASDIAPAASSVAQNSPGARAGIAPSKPGSVAKGTTPALDPASLATRQLSQRGPVRATVEQAVERARGQDTPATQAQERARRSADSQGEPEEALQRRDINAPAEQGADRAAKGMGFGAPDSGNAAAEDVPAPRPTAQDARGLDPEAQRTEPAPAHDGEDAAEDPERACAAPASSPGETAGNDGAVAAVAAAAMPASGPAPASSSIPPGGPAGSTAVEGVRGIAAKAVNKPQGPADPRQPATPEEQAQLAAPGVRGQAMRGVFSMLRGVSAGTTSGWMKLNPEALGEMKVTLAVQEGRVNASFAVSTDGAHAALKDSIADLREALRSRGLTLEAVEIHRMSAAKGGGVETGTSARHESSQDFSGLAGDSRSGPWDQGGSTQQRGQDAGDAGGGPGGFAAGAEAPEESTQTFSFMPGWKPGVDLTA